MFVRRSRLDAAERLIATLQASLEWMRIRLNHVEQERGAMMVKLTGISMVVPTIERVGSPLDTPHPMTEVPSFEDCGDDEARRYGISHNDDGTLEYLSHKQLGFE